MTLNATQKRKLVREAHSLKPVVTVGKNGITEALLAELDASLDTHELMKIKLPAGVELTDLAMIASKVDAEVLKLIGRVGILYRKSQD